MESLTPNLDPMSSPQPLKTIESPSGSVNNRPPMYMPALYDNKVLFLWEKHQETHNLKEISLENAHMSILGQIIEIVDDRCLHLSIQVKNICDVFHAHHHHSDEDSDTPTDIPFSMVKISTESKIDYLAAIEGNMIPLLGKLIDQLVSVISMNETDFDKIRGLVRERTYKIAGGILKN